MIVDEHERCINGMVEKNRWYKMAGKIDGVEVFRAVRDIGLELIQIEKRDREVHGKERFV